MATIAEGNIYSFSFWTKKGLFFRWVHIDLEAIWVVISSFRGKNVQIMTR